MGHLNQTQANIRSTKPKRVPLPEATEAELQKLHGKKEQDVYILVIDTWTMKTKFIQIRRKKIRHVQEVEIDTS